MANLTRCSNGHFYDPSTNRTCPYCAQNSGGTETVPLTPQDRTPKTPPIFTPKPENNDVTIGYYDDIVSKPVVGWLVSLEGSTRGKDFRLCSGRNYIGRNKDMDIVLEGDKMVSRSKHAIVVFDPVSQKTLCQAGESRELFYLNGTVVTDTVEVKKGDVITIGKTKLMFVPFCGDLHSWNAEE